MKCNECGKSMIKIERRTEMAELDEDATDGQMADYFAAEMSGDMGNWGIGVVEYKCTVCNLVIELISDSLENYDALISSWHQKAMEGDYFSRYVFEYLAFTAYVKNHVVISARSDRKAIQSLKRNSALAMKYLKKISGDAQLKKTWTILRRELKRQPLHNSSKDYDNPEIDEWWNNSGDEIVRPATKKSGVIHSLKDWPNMVEFWYATRNNLFHGGNNPDVQRDCFLVEQAFKTLNGFMKTQIKVENH